VAAQAMQSMLFGLPPSMLEPASSPVQYSSPLSFEEVCPGSALAGLIAGNGVMASNPLAPDKSTLGDQAGVICDGVGQVPSGRLFGTYPCSAAVWLLP
jgi:hypothetical protein